PSENPAEVALAGADKMVAGLPLPRPALAFGIRWLQRHPPPARRRPPILHTDARNGNLLVSANGLEAVLDWEGSVRHGDPMQDLAWPALRLWRVTGGVRGPRPAPATLCRTSPGPRCGCGGSRRTGARSAASPGGSRSWPATRRQ